MIYVPHTNLKKETKEALDQTGFEWTPVDVSNSETDYWNFLNDLWDQKKTFVVVEHDIVANKAAIESILECPHPWCAASYPYFTGEYAGLGCTKFEGWFLEQYPGAFKETAEMEDTDHPKKHWCRIDQWLWVVLNSKGFNRHIHWNVGVNHIHSNGPSHGCLVRG
jgi:hypothetical protein